MGVRLWDVAVDAIVGLAVEVEGIGVFVACIGIVVSRAIKRGKLCDASVGTVVGFEMERPVVS